MKWIPLLVLVTVITTSGCGPSEKELREQTLSTLNLEADRWDGGPEFSTTASDAFGNPLIASVEKETIHHVLEIRSMGPDGLPKNNDDIVVVRRVRHGESSYSDEMEKTSEKLGRGLSSGVIKGVKKGLGFDEGNKKQAEDPKEE